VKRHGDGNGRHRGGGTKLFDVPFVSALTEAALRRRAERKGRGRNRWRSEAGQSKKARERERERGSENRILERIRVDDISPPRREFPQQHA